ncbi:hypothetical protein L210DRAFT_3541758 [Boletus edulis BED1]|uniref:Glycosyltransferase family 25 protein n=1 Tax=Boletus edulis BED1 TaxID=1328754 RepID=A0AAD4BTV3_BOLED|nr:hypothetical protein L210DRAFT_3541758 [Boletus edulis BED1]
MTNADSSSAATMSNTPKIRPHLGIGIPRTHIYVISLAERQDRREQMELLRTTQNLTWTVVDAVPGNATLVNRIFDWVTLYHTESSSKVLGTSSFRWPEEINALSVSTHEPWKQSGSDTWSETSPSSKPKFPGKFGSSTYANLACATEDDSILALANDTPKWMVLSPAKVACWHSHVSAIRLFVERQDAHDRHRGDDVAVILEDDIDDISIRLSQIWTFLPAGWDIVFLGHCWSDESYYPALTEFADTYLHPSYYPKCTHAYALSLSGARRLLQHLRYPPFAYSRALDQAYAWLIRSGRLRSYSIVPSLIVQKKSAASRAHVRRSQSQTADEVSVVVPRHPRHRVNPRRNRVE